MPKAKQRQQKETQKKSRKELPKKLPLVGVNTSIGTRSVNADAFSVNRRLGLYAVADGVGEEGGRKAAWLR